VDERSQGYGQPSFRAEGFGHHYGAPAGGQSFAAQAQPYGQHGLANQGGQPYGQGGHAHYGATAQSYDPQQYYTSRWQRSAAQAHQGPHSSGHLSSHLSSQFASQFSNQFSNQGQPHGHQAWQSQVSQAGPSFGASRHEQYGATASSYEPQQQYSSQWQSYGPQGSTGQGVQFGRTSHEQYGATAASYDSQQQYSSQWQSYGGQAQAEPSFSNRAPFGQSGHFGQQQAYGGPSFSSQAGQFGQQASAATSFGTQSHGQQAFAGSAGSYSQQASGQQGMMSQAGQPFGQAVQQFAHGGPQQYGATAQSYNPQEHYSSRWQSQMADEQAGGAFRS